MTKIRYTNFTQRCIYLRHNDSGAVECGVIIYGLPIGRPLPDGEWQDAREITEQYRDGNGRKGRERADIRSDSNAIGLQGLLL